MVKEELQEQSMKESWEISFNGVGISLLCVFSSRAKVLNSKLIKKMSQTR